MKGNQNVIGIFVKRQVKPMIIVDSRIHLITNLPIITNVNSIVIIEQHNKILAELIMIGKKCKHVVLLIVDYLHLI